VTGAGFLFLCVTVVNGLSCCCCWLTLALRRSAHVRFSVGFPQMSRCFCGRGAAGVVVRRAAGGAAGVAMSVGLPCGLLWGALVSCWRTFWSSVVMLARCFSSSRIRLVLAAWAESIACSMCSNGSESCSIIWRSGSAREMPKLVFRRVLSARGGAERLCGGGANGVWALKGMSAGIVGLKGGGGEPRGTVADLEEGGGEPIETVLKQKFLRGR
jgi:hypothetical protein